MMFRVLRYTKFLILFFVTSACAQGDGFPSIGGASENVAIISSETGEHRIKLELAQDQETQRVGLMYRTELARDAGMLFIYDQPQPTSMWMKNTLISLDMAFIDENGVIKRIRANTTPRSLVSIRSGSPVIAVLEVNGGLFEELGVKEGDRVRHPIFKSAE